MTKRTRDPQQPEPLTTKQAATLRFVQDWERERGSPPRVEDIALGVEKKAISVGAAHARLGHLEQKGWIELTGKKQGIKILHRLPDPLDERVTVRVEGVIAAGRPIEALEGDELVEMPKLMAPGPGQYYLRVRGNSMVKAAILDGDLVLCRRQSTVDNGQIAHCLVDGTTVTLKRVYKEKRRVRLQPEADGYEPIYARDVAIQGKVIGIFRQVN
jgi:repressor LexA